MYLPYLRGRQYELLALRELVSKNLLSKYVIPIIEPVKLSPTLNKTIHEFSLNDSKIAIIRNPEVGSFVSEFNGARENSREESLKKAFEDLFNSRAVVKSIVMQGNAKSLLKYWDKKNINKEELIVINTNIDFINDYIEEFSDISPSYVLIPDESNFRRRIKKNRIMIDDKFEKQARNSDYQDIEDEFFSNDHIYFAEDEFNGFSDYSIIGKDYKESGFAPFAVAIHIVYFAEDNSLRVRHFVSNSNDDISNPAKKFYEAISKLHHWCIDNPIPLTYGLSELLNFYETKSYPGLGSVKKLSLMHHLELMSNFLLGEYQ